MFRRLGLLLSDRFVVFVLLGAALFLWNALNDDAASKIHVGEDDIAMLEGRWLSQSGARPSPEELRALIDFHITEEVLFREAIRLGFDQDDTIVRRRLVQKMEFYIQNQFSEPNLTDEELRDHFSRTQALYAQPKRVSFNHVYLGEHDDVPVQQASEILGRLAASNSSEHWRQVGQPFLFDQSVGLKSRAELSEMFGSVFADDLFGEDALRTWIGPLESSYGWHLVSITDQRAEQTLSFEQVRDRVRQDLIESRQQQDKDAFLLDLKSNYEISTAAPTQ